MNETTPTARLGAILIGGVLALAAAVAVLAQEVDFGSEVAPILDSLSEEQKATLLRWAESGALISDDYQLPTNPEAPPQGEALFEYEIAPLLARHCLECHDTGRKEGALDLSRKAAAFKGGDSGKAIHPGDGENSSIWELVDSDDMPENRPPLSVKEKALLKRWIDEGAVWSVDWIDPATYEHEGGGEQWVRRLTISEYIETVRSSTGVDIEDEAIELLPKDLRADGFNNTAYNLNVDMGHVNAYAQLASKIVEKMDTLEYAKEFYEKLKFTDKDMGILIERIGKRLLRGPLNEEEVILFRGISTTVASAGGEMGEAVAYLLEAMLQSPRFIYRIEKQQKNGANRRVGDFELASRLSYAIWGGPPDERLLDAAERGDLNQSAVLRAQVERMVNDPRAVDRSIQFAYEWLNLGRMDNLRPNPEKFPKWDSGLAADMRAETLATFEEIAWTQKAPLADLLNAQVTFLTPELAKHYGINLKGADNASDALVRHELASNPNRGGLLTQGSVLTMGGDDASMVTRGLFVLHDLLRGTVKDPPPCLDTTPVPSSRGQSQRVISEERIANNSCGGCHSKFEPLAFGLERFDGLGGYYKRDVFGNRLRQDGEILFPGEADSIPYKTSAELMDLLASSDRVKETITWKLAQYVMGRPLGGRDASQVLDIHTQAMEQGGTYQSLMRVIATSDMMRRRSSFPGATVALNTTENEL